MPIVTTFSCPVQSTGRPLHVSALGKVSVWSFEVTTLRAVPCSIEQGFA
jgi:hypothetical protein